MCCLAAECDLQWRDIHQLIDSECPSYSIFSIFRKEQEIAISNIIFTFLILIIMVVGLSMMALDFQVWECGWECGGGGGRQCGWECDMWLAVWLGVWLVEWLIV